MPLKYQSSMPLSFPDQSIVLLRVGFALLVYRHKTGLLAGGKASDGKMKIKGLVSLEKVKNNAGITMKKKDSKI